MPVIDIPSLSPLCTTNVNALWGGCIGEVLARLGVKDVVISPGSRSTPLVVGFASNPNINAISILDERSAAFFALGIAKRTQKPTVLICSSGTAVANFFPAVIEASMSHIPLIVLTADRPPEMRECHSGQTIDQVKLYGNYVKFYKELGLPEATKESLHYLRQTLVHAYGTASHPYSAPIHLNIPFRDPLAPITDDAFQAQIKNLDLETILADTKTTEPSSLSLNSDQVNTLMHQWQEVEQGLIVVGTVQPSNTKAFVNSVTLLANNLGWPVLAEGLSPLRNHASKFPGLITRYDTIVRSAKANNTLKPKAVINIGDFPTSKPLRAFLKNSTADTWTFNPTDHNIDPLHRNNTHLKTSLELFSQQISAHTRETTAYMKDWLACEHEVSLEIERSLNEKTSLFEGNIARLLSEHLPKKTPIFVASSMPVRDVEYFWKTNDLEIKVFFNRGANGIDGTLSTAMGVAHNSTKPAVLLTGDLSFLHDSNGMLAQGVFNGSLTVILVNNDGGGVFEHLPISQFESLFEPFVATPQKVDFRKFVESLGGSYENPQSWNELTPIIQELPMKGLRVIEVKTNRKRDAAFRKQLFETIAKGLDI